MWSSRIYNDGWRVSAYILIFFQNINKMHTIVPTTAASHNINTNIPRQSKSSTQLLVHSSLIRHLLCHTTCWQSTTCSKREVCYFTLVHSCIIGQVTAGYSLQMHKWLIQTTMIMNSRAAILRVVAKNIKSVTNQHGLHLGGSPLHDTTMWVWNYGRRNKYLLGTPLILQVWWRLFMFMIVYFWWLGRREEVSEFISEILVALKPMEWSILEGWIKSIWWCPCII